jgi:hypothetical protein
MFRYLLPATFLVILLLAITYPLAVGCSGSGDFATPLYVNSGQDPNAAPEYYIANMYIEPTGVNLAVGGMQQFKVTAAWNNGDLEEKTAEVEWYTENPAIGAFEPSGGRFLAQHPGVAIVRCRIMQEEGLVTSDASFVNAFNPNADLPPAVPLNPMVNASDEGATVYWDLNATDGDMAGYNIWRTQVSAAHYTTDYGKVNDYPILYPPYLDDTVVSGWYFYRVTAEDLLGLYSAPSEEVAVFMTGQSHYANAYD